MRVDAFTGRTDHVDAWLSGRQTQRWVVQTPRVPADADKRLGELTELHRRGVVTDAEFAQLRARVSPRRRDHPVRRSEKCAELGSWESTP